MHSRTAGFRAAAGRGEFSRSGMGQQRAASRLWALAEGGQRRDYGFAGCRGNVETAGPRVGMEAMAGMVGGDRRRREARGWRELPVLRRRGGAFEPVAAFVD